MSPLSDLSNRAGCDACALHVALASCDAVFLASHLALVVGGNSGVNALASTRVQTQGLGWACRLLGAT